MNLRKKKALATKLANEVLPAAKPGTIKTSIPQFSKPSVTVAPQTEPVLKTPVKETVTLAHVQQACFPPGSRRAF